MFNSHSQNPHPQKTRFYLFMIVLVVAGLFFLLYLNDDGNVTSLSSAIIGYAPDNQSAADNSGSIISEKELQESITKDLGKSTKNVNIMLSFDGLPIFKNEAKVGSIELRFDDPETSIEVNDDRLELNGIKEVNLVISGFSGELIFEKGYISLDGTAKKMEVNGISFSSDDDLSILFKKLNYNSLYVSDVELKGLEFERGSGSLEVNERLEYRLVNDWLSMYYFHGKMSIDKNSNATLLDMQGEALGLGVSGDLMSFSLK